MTPKCKDCKVKYVRISAGARERLSTRCLECQEKNYNAGLKAAYEKRKARAK